MTTPRTLFEGERRPRGMCTLTSISALELSASIFAISSSTTYMSRSNSRHRYLHNLIIYNLHHRFAGGSEDTRKNEDEDEDGESGENVQESDIEIEIKSSSEIKPSQSTPSRPRSLACLDNFLKGNHDEAKNIIRRRAAPKRYVCINT